MLKPTISGSVALNKKKRKWGQTVFLTCLFTLPIIHTLLFFFGLNGQSILLAFQKYDVDLGKYVWNGINNFVDVMKSVSQDELVKTSMQNALLFWLLGTIVCTPLSWFCSYFIVKKVPFHEGFKVIFFLPTILSSVVMVLMFKYFCDYAIPDIASKWFGVKDMPLLLSEYPYAIWTLMVFNLWHTFAGNMVINIGALSRVSDSVIEAAKIDGVNNWKEFWHIYFPQLYTTQIVAWLAGVIGIFLAGPSIFTFYGTEAPLYTYTTSYYLFMKVVGENSTLADYPYAAAAGLTITCVAAPLSFFLKWFLAKIGPKED